MKVTERGAARILADASLGYEQARRVLRSGVAGVPDRTSGAVLYEESKVRGLLERRLPPEPWPIECSQGLFVLRGRNETSVGAEFRIHTALRIAYRLQLEAGRRIPLLLTVCHYVVTAREVVDLEITSENRTRLLTEPAGAWADSFRDSLLFTRRGNPLLWLGPCPWEGLGHR